MTDSKTDVITGTIAAVNQRATDKWQIEVNSGGQYNRKLWTKDAELVSQLSQRLGQSETFQINGSDWINNEGKPVTSWWINAVGEGAASAVATTSSGKSTAQEYQREYSPETIARMERHQLRDLKAQAWQVTAALYGSQPGITVGPEGLSDETELRRDFNHFKFFQTLVLADIAGDLSTQVQARDTEFGGPPDVPFD